MLKIYISILILVINAFSQYQSKIMTYNLLNYTNSSRDSYFRTIFENVNPDVLIVQEITSLSATENLLDTVLNFSSIRYNKGIFIDGPDTDNEIFFVDSLFTFISNTPILTNLRDINEFKLVYNHTIDTLRIYSAHLKAGSSPSDIQQRLEEVNILRQVTDNLPIGSNFLVVGDFNLYTSTEPAYQALLNTTNSGYVLDPIDSPGDWNNNIDFAPIHTQSTRTRSFGGGATGGLDDRFDFILASQGVLDEGDVSIIQGTYQAYGNDGMHFNDSINQLPNTAVPAEVANALHYASDHLPVICELEFQESNSIVDNDKQIPSNFIVYQNYPNPFNPFTTIKFFLPKSEMVTISIYDVRGRLVESESNQYHQGINAYEFNGNRFSSGLYFYQVSTSAGKLQTKKMLLQK